MTRPSFAAIFWFLAFIVALALLIRSRNDRPAPQTDEDSAFDRKVFYDSNESGTGTDEIVTISGTLSGKGIGYKNNTTNISCYKDTFECLVTAVQQIGVNQIGRLQSPEEYKVIKWDSFEVVAVDEPDSLACNKVTISIGRRSKTALRVQEPTNQASVRCKDSDTKIYKWTIEDSLFWQRNHNFLRK